MKKVLQIYIHLYREFQDHRRILKKLVSACQERFSATPYENIRTHERDANTNEHAISWQTRSLRFKPDSWAKIKRRLGRLIRPMS